MTIKQKFASAIVLAFAVFTFSTFAAAQETPNQNDSMQQRRQEKFNRRGDRRNGEGRRGDKMKMRMLEKLNLTDSQKQQIKVINDSFENSTGTQREEMRGLAMKKRDGVITEAEQTRFDELRTQFKTAAKQSQGSIMAILTDDQRAQLEKMKEERKQKMMERRQNRQNQQMPEDN